MCSGQGSTATTPTGERHGPRAGAQVGHAPGGRVRRARGRPGLFRGRLGAESVRASDERLALLDRLHDCRMEQHGVEKLNHSAGRHPSAPILFGLHALIFSNDAVTLETALH